MLTGKQGAAVLIFGVFLSSGLYAQNIMGTHFDGDALNATLGRYSTNVSNLIPDSTSMQNIWSLVPKTNGTWGGIGLNGSLTFYDQKDVSGLVKNASSFVNSMDLASFPESVPYLPGLAVDLRGGYGGLDAGLSLMWIDDDIVTEYIGGFLGDGNHFSYRMIGVDLRYTLVKDGGSFFGLFRSPLLPAVTVQGGYYFTWIGFGISAGDTEKVNAQFRNDTVFFALQASKQIFFVAPYIGMKLIFSKTDSEYDWETHRPVMLRGNPYPEGLSFKSGIKEGEFYTYFQLYAGVGLNIMFPHLITVGGAYNTVTNHFAINASVRFIVNSGVY